MRLSTLSLALLLLGQLNSLQAADNAPSIEFGGRLHGDATYYDNDKYEYTDGSELRRGRVYAGGNITDDWEYRVQVEFSGDEPELKDGYLRYSGMTNAQITLGQFKQFSGLEYLTSSNNMTFTERAMAIGLVTDRRMGIGYQRWDDRYTFAASAYTHEANNNARGTGMGGRFVYRPQVANGLFHLGVNLSRENDDNDNVRYRARPDSHQDSHRIIDTGAIANVDNLNRYGLEAAWVRDRFSVQTEYVNLAVNRRLDADVTLDGYYLSLAYFLSHDTRPYSNSNGAFSTLTPSASSGAWEIAARFSSLDLSDYDIAGGAADTLTFGLNYYLNRDVRFMANYIMADSDEVAGDDDPNALQLRIRITF